MDWMNWKTWAGATVLIIAVFAIYVFAAPEPPPEPLGGTTGASQPRTVVRTPGVEPVHEEWLEPQVGSYRTKRNLFAFPAPPPPPLPQAPPPPPDKDKDGIPDFQDNCVNVVNGDQQDIDRDGIGTACETETEIAPAPPPPPERQPPPFDFKYIGTFGSPSNPIATFARGGDIVNARVGDIIDNKFVLRSIGIESVEISFIGFPQERRQRIPLGQ